VDYQRREGKEVYRCEIERSETENDHVGKIESRIGGRQDGGDAKGESDEFKNRRPHEEDSDTNGIGGIFLVFDDLRQRDKCAQEEENGE
jgi:hypothetical protein